MNVPNHSHHLTDEILDIIARAHWQTAKSVQHVEGGQHQYNVLGWSKDDLTEREFWQLANLIQTCGRREEWMPPPGFYDDPRKRRPMQNHYLYFDGPDGIYAYWYTKPRSGPPMLNREHVSVQERTGTRTPVPPSLFDR
jgi:hypothetical protein